MRQLGKQGEEFGINIADIIPVTLVSGMSEEYCPSQVFLCTNIMENRYVSIQRWKMPDLRDVESLLDMNLFLPFKLSLEDFLRQLNEIRLTLDESQSNIETDGGPGSGRYPKGSGKRMKRVALRKEIPVPCQ